MFSRLFPVLALLLIAGCQEAPVTTKSTDFNGPYIAVLGIAQDAGFPQAGCAKECCAEAWVELAKRRMVSCLGLVDPVTRKCWMFDATPDFPDQLKLLNKLADRPVDQLPDGIFLTHGHIGHYTGLMHFGREVMGAGKVPVYAMPRMAAFLRQNGPWSQLVSLNQIELKPLGADSSITLAEGIRVTPFLVPHRDEFSETVGFQISTQNRSAVFIPDIDKWEKWERDINAVVSAADYALLDATFYSGDELPGRDMSEIPHPFVVESMERFTDKALRDKIHFIHLNHSNPLLNEASAASKSAREAGFHVAAQGATLPLD